MDKQTARARSDMRCALTKIAKLFRTNGRVASADEVELCMRAWTRLFDHISDKHKAKKAESGETL